MLNWNKIRIIIRLELNLFGKLVLKLIKYYNLTVKNWLILLKIQRRSWLILFTSIIDVFYWRKYHDWWIFKKIKLREMYWRWYDINYFYAIVVWRLYQYNKDDFYVYVLIFKKLFSSFKWTTSLCLHVNVYPCCLKVRIKNWNRKSSSLFWCIRRRYLSVTLILFRITRTIIN